MSLAALRLAGGARPQKTELVVTCELDVQAFSVLRGTRVTFVGQMGLD